MRFNPLKSYLSKTSTLAHADFEPNGALLDFLHEDCHVLVVGAGGLGCEILKNLALMGFGRVDVIDMDTIGDWFI